jgi:citrate lyase beta subunit
MLQRQDIHDEIQGLQERLLPPQRRGRLVPYRRRGVMAIPAFKMRAGGDPATDGRAQTWKLLQKAAELPADGFFYDLEDAAPDHPEFKAFARQYCAEALQEFDFAKRIVAFRPNDVRSPYFEADLVDVLTAAGAKLHALVIAKTEDAAEVAAIARLVAQIQRHAGHDNRPMLEVLIESPRAFQQAQQIAAIPSVASLTFGAWDFARLVGGEVRAQTWTTDLLAVRQLLPVIAASEGKDAIDAVTATLPIRPTAQPGTPEHAAQVRDRENALLLAARDAENAKVLGFAGKWLLHPEQIAPIQNAWLPTRERALAALAQAVAYARAAQTGSGAELTGVQLADRAVIGADWWLVEDALAGGVMTAAECEQSGVKLAALRAIAGA